MDTSLMYSNESVNFVFDPKLQQIHLSTRQNDRWTVIRLFGQDWITVPYLSNQDDFLQMMSTLCKVFHATSVEVPQAPVGPTVALKHLRPALAAGTRITFDPDRSRIVIIPKGKFHRRRYIPVGFLSNTHDFAEFVILLAKVHDLAPDSRARPFHLGSIVLKPWYA